MNFVFVLFLCGFCELFDFFVKGTLKTFKMKEFFSNRRVEEMTACSCQKTPQIGLKNIENMTFDIIVDFCSLLDKFLK